MKTALIIIGLIVLLLCSFQLMNITTMMYDKAMDKACQEKGFKKAMYSDNWFCQNEEGFYILVERECNFLGDKCKISS